VAFSALFLALFLTVFLALYEKKVVFIRAGFVKSFVLVLPFCITYNFGSIGLYATVLVDVEYDFCIFLVGITVRET
jgi:hypothetical protein